MTNAARRVLLIGQGHAHREVLRRGVRRWKDHAGRAFMAKYALPAEAKSPPAESVS